MSVKYVAKVGSQLMGDVQAKGEFLEAMRQRDGMIDRYSVTDAARDPLTPIHEDFEWDDEVAAEEYRFEQARHLIRSICVVHISEKSDEPQIIRAFVSVTTPDDRKEFTSTFVALADETLRKQVLLRALKELDAWERKYAELQELAEVFSAVESARKQLSKKEAA